MIVINHLHILTEEDALGKINEKDEEAMKIIDKVYFEDVDKDSAEMHDERFSEWDEEENISLGFNRQYF